MEEIRVLTLQNVTRVYRAADVETSALNDVSLRIEPGEFVAVTGPSGCGKSTLLNILGLLDVPSSGEYEFFGERISGRSEDQLALLRRAGVAFVFQNFNLLPDLSVEANVGVPLQYRRVPAGERRGRVAKALEQVGLAHRAKHRPSQLSGGQQQRVAVARALVTQPRLLLADEPTGNLDSDNGKAIMEILAGIREAGCTVIMVTHSPQHARYAGRTIQMRDGRVAQ
jgi:putative ABC transport system ATP-binding protein